MLLGRLDNESFIIIEMYLTYAITQQTFYNTFAKIIGLVGSIAVRVFV